MPFEDKKSLGFPRLHDWCRRGKFVEVGVCGSMQLQIV